MSSGSREVGSGRTPAVATDMEIKVRTQGPLALIEIWGELCLSSAERFVVDFQALREQGSQQVVLDLRQVTFMDSTGVRVLIDSETHAQENGLSFAVVAGDGQPARVLDLAGMSERPARVQPQELPAA